jgi:hypothetical protein
MVTSMGINHLLGGVENGTLDPSFGLKRINRLQTMTMEASLWSLTSSLLARVIGRAPFTLCFHLRGDTLVWRLYLPDSVRNIKQWLSITIPSSYGPWYVHFSGEANMCKVVLPLKTRMWYITLPRPFCYDLSFCVCVYWLCASQMIISHVALFIYVYHIDILSLSFSRIIMCLTFLLTQICDMSRQILRSQEFPALARDVLALPAFRFRFKYMIQMLKNLSEKLARISRHSKCSESWSTENQ